jgi:hypothetical protein
VDALILINNREIIALNEVLQQGLQRFFNSVSAISRLVISESKTLSEWLESDSITTKEKDILSKLARDGFLSYIKKYTLETLKKLVNNILKKKNAVIVSKVVKNSSFENFEDDFLTEFKNLIKRKANDPDPFGEEDKFSTWFNKNCSILISQLEPNSLYDVWIAVHEAPFNLMKGNSNVVWINENSTIEKARRKAIEIKEKMNSFHPMLPIAPSLQVFYFNKYLFVNVIKIDLTHLLARENFKELKDNPDFYIKPLDIIKRLGDENSSLASSKGISSVSFFHSAIYLGKGQVCHIFANSPSISNVSSSSKSTWRSFISGGMKLNSFLTSPKAKAHVRIDSWEEFLTKSPQN